MMCLLPVLVILSPYKKAGSCPLPDQGSTRMTAWDPGKLELEAISAQSHLCATRLPEI